ncbi:MAG: helix-turn-helix domain-containing protein [Gemmatimonadota bacterium]|nr:helix-turn-helix domain-containing protein [Gemmatimonadota bacterium]
MPLLALVAAHPAWRLALRRGLPPTIRIRSCRNVGQVEGLLRRELVDAVLLRVHGADWAHPIPALRERYPRVPVFGYGPVRADDARRLADGLAGGIEGILVEGVDEPVAGEVVASRAASRQREHELADAPRLLRLSEDVQRRAWQVALAGAGQRLTTSDVARAVGTSREHLSREFAAGGAPNLKRVIDLARVACAADLLRNPGYDVQTCAGVLRFASAGHLAGTTRRIAGVAPSGLGRLGPRGVLQRFLRGRTRSRI